MLNNYVECDCLVEINDWGSKFLLLTVPDYSGQTAEIFIKNTRQLLTTSRVTFEYKEYNFYLYLYLITVVIGK